MDLSIIINSQRCREGEDVQNLALALITVLQLEMQAIGERAAIELMMVDSGTDDSDLRTIIQQFPSVRIVPSRLPLNAAQSYNLGANLARSRSLLFLRADALLAHGCLLNCLDMVLMHPRTSLFYGSLLDQSGRTRADARNQTATPAGVSFDWVEGVPMLLSKQVFLELGGFNEQLDEVPNHRGVVIH